MSCFLEAATGVFWVGWTTVRRFLDCSIKLKSSSSMSTLTVNEGPELGSSSSSSDNAEVEATGASGVALGLGPDWLGDWGLG